MEREYYIISDYAALKHLLQQKSVGTYQYRYKRFVMVLERNHRFLPPQISWIVDFNSVCFILISGSSVITQIDHRLDHRCLLPPLSPNRRPACVSCPAAAAACARLYQVAAACAQLFPGFGGALPRPAIRARLFPSDAACTRPSLDSCARFFPDSSTTSIACWPGATLPDSSLILESWRLIC